MRGRTVSAIAPPLLIEEAGLGKRPVGAVREPPVHRQCQREFPHPGREGVWGRGNTIKEFFRPTLTHFPPGREKHGVAAWASFVSLLLLLLLPPPSLNAAQITDDRGAAVTVATRPSGSFPFTAA